MKKILIKLTGEIFSKPEILKNIVEQIKKLQDKYNIGLVVGAGNIFRGNQHGKSLGLKQSTGHTCGMIATHINSLILQDLLTQNNIATSMFSSLNCQSMGCIIKQENIDKAIKNNSCLIFAGGTGNPFFTTDTAAILRALQIGATEVWKGTKVDGVYNNDPEKSFNNELYKNLTYEEFIHQKLGIMDLTSISLAQENKIKVRVFNIFKNNALLDADKDENLGSTIGLGQ